MKKLITCLLLLILLTGCSNNKYENGELNVLNWSSYIPDTVIKDFEQQYKIKVNYGTYSSNEELLAKINNSKSGTYDLIFPSDYMVELMEEKELLNNIDKTKIPNYTNINEIFLNQNYDSNNNYSLPFLMTHVVIAVDSSSIKNNINNYNDLLNEEYKNNIVVLDDQRIIIGSALIASGNDINSLNSNIYKTTKDYLLELKKNIKAFDSDSPKSFLITNEVDIGLMWSAEAILAKQYNPNIKIIIPRSGYAISMDNYCILKNSKNEENAYKFINYLLDENINKKIIESYPYISTLKGLNKYSDTYLKDIIDNGSYVKNIGYDIKYYDDLWAEIK